MKIISTIDNLNGNLTIQLDYDRKKGHVITQFNNGVCIQDRDTNMPTLTRGENRIQFLQDLINFMIACVREDMMLIVQWLFMVIGVFATVHWFLYLRYVSSGIM